MTIIHPPPHVFVCIADTGVTGATGASIKQHPAPFPIELTERLVRIFSFVGDTVLKYFLVTGTSTVAAAEWGRNSIGFEVDPH
jgi:modification methylase